MSTFDPSLYNAERAPRLVEPYRVTPTAARVGRNPLTGEVVPAVFIGTFAPGQPNLYAAMRQSFEKFFRTPPLQVAPRVGFALDVFGNGKTALRGGFGVFPDRFSDSRASFHMVQVPQVANNSAYYTTIPSLLTSLLVDSPNNIQSMQTDFSPPTVYNWSFGVQQDVGFGTVLDVAYVASVGRRLLQRRNLNAAPYGTNLLAGNIDSTLPGGQPLPPNFLRPIRGYGDILYNEFASSSNYHSLQAQANRRFTRRLTFGLTYTWSKALNLVDTDNEAVNPFLDFRMRNYGRASFDRLHNLVFSWDYLLPSPTGGTPLLRVLFNGWQLAGIASFISGQPTAIGYSFVQALDITGAIGAGPDSRVILTGNPNLPRAERTSERHFRTEVVAPPEAANFGIGNAPKDPIRGPGTNNWDISLFKNFPLSNDGQRRLQLRWETYNTFNHTQFNALDAAARFDGTGRQVNSRLGQYTGTSDARRMQLALKFYF